MARKQSPNQLANLKTPTPKEARENGRKGGIASGEARKQKKTWQEIATAMLSTKLDEKSQEALSHYGIEKGQADYNCFFIYKLMQKAKDGDLSAIQELKNLTGNKEVQQISLSGSVALTDTQKEIEKLLDE